MSHDRQTPGIALSQAKINLGLRILGRRADGFHNIDTVMQTISLFDRITMTANGSGLVTCNLPDIAGEQNLIARAIRSFAARCGKTVDVDFDLRKRIPVAAGLGGGSSNAASALQLLASYWGLAADDARLFDAALESGSDVPFFLVGGTARATGRGETLEPLTPKRARWVVLMVPALTIEQKTARLYGALRQEDFSACPTGDSDLHNAFERPLYDNFPVIADAARALRKLTDAPVALSGAGPAHYALLNDPGSAIDLLFRAAREPELRNCSFHLARTMQSSGPILTDRNQTRVLRVLE